MDVFWVILFVAVICISKLAATGDTKQQEQPSKIDRLLSQLNELSDVKPPTPKDDQFRVYMAAYPTYNVHRGPSILWQTERQITLLQKRIGEEENVKQKQKLETELRTLRKYESSFAENIKRDKVRLLKLLGNDLNNLEKSLKLLDLLRDAAKGKAKLPKILDAKVVKKFRLLSALKAEVTATGNINSVQKDQALIHKYKNEYELFLYAVVVRQQIRAIYLEEWAQRTYFDLARRTLGVLCNPLDFKNKLLSNEDLRVQLALYNIHYMDAVEKCDLGTVGELLKKYPNENCGGVLKELIGQGVKERNETIFEDFDDIAEILKVKIISRTVKEPEEEIGEEMQEQLEEQNPEENDQQPDEQSDEQDLGEENRAHPAEDTGEQSEEEETHEQIETQPEAQTGYDGSEEETDETQTEQQADEHPDTHEGTETQGTGVSEAAEEELRDWQTTEQTPFEETQQESQQKADDEQKEEAPEQKEPEYEQWAEDWPWVRRCDPPSRILRLSDFMVKQGFGTGWYAEDAKPVPPNYL